MKQLLSLSDEVCARLEQEKPGTKSALVDAILARHYGITLPDGEPHQQLRHEILAELEFEETAEPEPKATVPVVEPIDDDRPQMNDVKINLLGRPADQMPDGDFVFTDEEIKALESPETPDVEFCQIHGRQKIGGICLDCL